MNLPTIQLDWRAYFKAFCEIHGGNPVLYEGHLLFQDGWRYSVDSLSGIEYAAPVDETALTKLQIGYWETRRDIVEKELQQLAIIRGNLASTQRDRSAPLQYVIRVVDDETGKRVSRTVPLDIGMFDTRLKWLKDDIEECATMIVALTHRLSVIASKLPIVIDVEENTNG